MLRARRRFESGQAAVESAIVMPLCIFMILGIMQIFMMLQARILSNYAVFRATRAGSVSQGDCQRMIHAAALAMLPAITNVDTPANLVAEFSQRVNGMQAKLDERVGNSTFDGDMLWLFRELDPPGSLTGPSGEDPNYDAPRNEAVRLQVRMVFWYPMRIPFANWVLNRTFRAAFGIQDYQRSNPLMPTQDPADWELGTRQIQDLAVRGEFDTRSSNGEYVFPIQTTYSMRMMTPPRTDKFSPMNCPPTP